MSPKPNAAKDTPEPPSQQAKPATQQRSRRSSNDCAAVPTQKTKDTHEEAAVTPQSVDPDNACPATTAFPPAPITSFPWYPPPYEVVGR